MRAIHPRALEDTFKGIGFVKNLLAYLIFAKVLSNCLFYKKRYVSKEIEE